MTYATNNPVNMGLAEYEIEIYVMIYTCKALSEAWGWGCRRRWVNVAWGWGVSPWRDSDSVFEPTRIVVCGGCPHFVVVRDVSDEASDSSASATWGRLHATYGALRHCTLITAGGSRIGGYSM